MAGNGYFAEGRYQPKSTETWASLTGNWSTYTSWEFTPSLPLTFTTNVIDFGREETVNYQTFLEISGVASTTIYSGTTVDSSGGSIDSPTSTTINVGDTPTAITGRYFQFAFSVDYDDSAGAETTPSISAIDTKLTVDTITVNKDSIDSSTLTGSTGIRQLSAPDVLSSVRTAVITAHAQEASYVADGYVVGDSSGEIYVEAGSTIIPHVLLDKSTDPITLNIYDLNTFGPTKVDCVFDATLTGLPGMTVDNIGQITTG